MQDVPRMCRAAVPLNPLMTDGCSSMGTKSLSGVLAACLSRGCRAGGQRPPPQPPNLPHAHPQPQPRLPHTHSHTEKNNR